VFLLVQVVHRVQVVFLLVQVVVLAVVLVVVVMNEDHQSVIVIQGIMLPSLVQEKEKFFVGILV
jgi:hypothetical protein